MRSAFSGNRMKAVQPDPGWIPLLKLATQEVFERMLGTSLQNRLDSAAEETPELTAIVGLAGRLAGTLSIHCPAVSARRMAEKMLVLDSAEVEGYVVDAVGEICNMVAGNFKSKVSDLAEGCNLSVPTVITGGDYHLRPLACEEALEVGFTFEGCPMWVTLEWQG